MNLRFSEKNIDEKRGASISRARARALAPRRWSTERILVKQRQPGRNIGLANSASAMEPSLSFARYPSLDNAVVFVTGGASGIGEYMVRAFAEQGTRVGFVDIAVEAGRALRLEIMVASHRRHARLHLRQGRGARHDAIVCARPRQHPIRVNTIVPAGER